MVWTEFSYRQLLYNGGRCCVVVCRRREDVGADQNIAPVAEFRNGSETLTNSEL